MRAGRISASTIAETMSLMNRAANILNGAVAAGKSVATDIYSVAQSATLARPASGTTVPTRPDRRGRHGWTSTGRAATTQWSLESRARSSGAQLRGGASLNGGSAKRARARRRNSGREGAVAPGCGAESGHAAHGREADRDVIHHGAAALSAPPLGTAHRPARCDSRQAARRGRDRVHRRADRLHPRLHSVPRRGRRCLPARARAPAPDRERRPRRCCSRTGRAIRRSSAD